MIRNRSLPVLALCAVLILGAPACATTQDEIIRTAAGASQAPAPAPEPQQAEPAVASFTAQDFTQISDTLDEAAAAWSEGDIDKVITYYISDQPLLVLIGDTPLKGPEPVRELLAQYQQRPGQMGTMNYEWFEILQLDAHTAAISGRIVLTRDGQQYRGLFTRIMRRTTDGWKIMHDHLALPPEA